MWKACAYAVEGSSNSIKAPGSEHVEVPFERLAYGSPLTRRGLQHPQANDSPFTYRTSLVYVPQMFDEGDYV